MHGTVGELVKTMELHDDLKDCLFGASAVSFLAWGVAPGTGGHVVNLHSQREADALVAKGVEVHFDYDREGKRRLHPFSHVHKRMLQRDPKPIAVAVLQVRSGELGSVTAEDLCFRRHGSAAAALAAARHPQMVQGQALRSAFIYRENARTSAQLHRGECDVAACLREGRPPRELYSQGGYLHLHLPGSDPKTGGPLLPLTDTAIDGAQPRPIPAAPSPSARPRRAPAPRKHRPALGLTRALPRRAPQLSQAARSSQTPRGRSTAASPATSSSRPSTGARRSTPRIASSTRRRARRLR